MSEPSQMVLSMKVALAFHMYVPEGKATPSASLPIHDSEGLPSASSAVEVHTRWPQLSNTSILNCFRLTPIGVNVLAPGLKLVGAKAFGMYNPLKINSYL